METKVFQTNLKCGNCVSKVAPALDGDPQISEWSVRTDDSRKLLSVTGTHVEPDHVRSLIKKAGFEVFDEISEAKMEAAARAISEASASRETYFPLMLVFFYLAGFVVLSQISAGHWSSMSSMNAFMGSFSVVFSFFKLLNIRGFADAYRSYDIVASRLPVYGYFYPFIELTLGVCYLTAFAPLATNLANCAVMSVGAIGVARALFR